MKNLSLETIANKQYDHGMNLIFVALLLVAAWILGFFALETRLDRLEDLGGLSNQPCAILACPETGDSP